MFGTNVPLLLMQIYYIKQKKSIITDALYHYMRILQKCKQENQHEFSRINRDRSKKSSLFIKKTQIYLYN